MKNYPINTYGMIISEEMAKIICLKLWKNYEGKNYKYDLVNEGICDLFAEFTGYVKELNDDGKIKWDADIEEYNNAPLCYIPLSKSNYRNKKKMVQEIKKTIGQYLPNNFDYKIYNISGTYI